MDVKRATVTAVWFLSLAAFFRWWEVTLLAPGLQFWTLVYLVFYVGAAWWMTGRSVVENRDFKTAVAVWGGTVLLVPVLAWLVPFVEVGGWPVTATVFAGALDVVVPLWIAVRVNALVWEVRQQMLVLGGALVFVALSFLIVVVHMPGSSYDGPQFPLTAEQRDTRDRLETHVRVLAEMIGERNDGRLAALDSAAEYIERMLSETGHDVSVHSYRVATQEFKNLDVTIPGTERPDEIVVIGGHYDSVEGAPGANDNASGTAAVLELARILAGERYGRTVRLVAFTNEEPPFFETEFMGSRVYADQTAAAGDNIVAMISMETIGYYSDEPGSQDYPFPFNLLYPDRGNFIGFVGNIRSRALVRRSIHTFRESTAFPSQGAAAPAWIPGIGWSDHSAFWRHGVPAIMITDTAPFRYPYYHTMNDTPDRLDYDRMAVVVVGVAEVVRELANPG